MSEPETSFPQEPLHVAVAQMTSSDSVEENQKQILSLLSQAQGADLITFPENALFFLVDRKSKMESFDLSDSLFDPIKNFAEKNRCHILLGSIPLKEEGKISNAMLWVQPDGQISVPYKKIHLFDVEVKDHPPVRESDHFIHGDQPAVIEVKGWRMGLSICYDIRFSELFYKYRLLNAHLLFAPAAFLVPTGKSHWHVLLRARAIENQAFLLAPAQSGEHKSCLKKGQSRFTYGHSLIVGPWGDVLNEAQQDQPLVLRHILNPEEIKQVREQIPMKAHRRIQFK